MIIGLLGLIGSGKGTVAEYLSETHGYRQDSFAASLKDICATMFDWPRNLLEGDTPESREWRNKIDTWWANKLEIPDFTPRRALQLVGTNSLRNHFHPDTWMLTFENRIRKASTQAVVISDVRFPNEINLIRNTGGKLILVERGNKPVWFNIAIKAYNGNEDAVRDMYESFPEVHQSEWGWVGCNTDLIITNNGTLSDLYSDVDAILK